MRHLHRRHAERPRVQDTRPGRHRRDGGNRHGPEGPQVRHRRAGGEEGEKASRPRQGGARRAHADRLLPLQLQGRRGQVLPAHMGAGHHGDDGRQQGAVRALPGHSRVLRGVHPPAHSPARALYPRRAGHDARHPRRDGDKERRPQGHLRGNPPDSGQRLGDRRHGLLLPPHAPPHGRGLRPPREGRLHLLQRGRGVPHPHRPRPQDRPRGVLRDTQALRGERPRPRDIQPRRAERRGRHMQLLRLLLLLPAHSGVSEDAGRHTLELRRRGRREQVRRLRPLRRELQPRRAQAGPEALLHPQQGPRARHPARQAALVRRGQLRQVLPHEPRLHRRRRHRALQDALSGAYPRPGLHKAREHGQVRRGARAHQEGEPLPGGLRPRLPALLRGGLLPRRRGRARRDRRGQEVPRPARARPRHPPHPQDAQHDRQALHEQDSRRRLRPRRPLLRVLPRAPGLPRHRV